MADQSEVFVGRAVGEPYGHGRAELRSSSGVECEVAYQHQDQTKGIGTMVCDDGRIGALGFGTEGNLALGRGELNGKPFIFKVGQ